MLALIILLANPSGFSFWVVVGYALLLVAAGLTLWSMVQYFASRLAAFEDHLDQIIKLSESMA
jgi:hypothetical protein